MHSNFRMKPVRGARAFIPKNKAIFIRKCDIPETALNLRCEKPKTPGSHRALPKCLPVGVLMDIQRAPIIHACTPKIAIIYDITQGVNQMQPGTGQRAHPPDIAGILGNFRLKEDNVNHRDDRICNQAGRTREREPE